MLSINAQVMMNMMMQMQDSESGSYYLLRM